MRQREEKQEELQFQARKPGARPLAGWQKEKTLCWGFILFRGGRYCLEDFYETVRTDAWRFSDILGAF